MRKTLKFSPDAKDAIEWIKKTYDFANYSIAIETIANFFKINKLNPKDLTYGNIENTVNFNRDKIIDLENKNTERIISIIRNIEINLFHPMNKKLIDIHGISVNDYNKNHNNTIENNLDNSIELLQKNKIIDELKNELLETKNKLLEYHRCLETLNKSVKVLKIDNEYTVIFNGSEEEVQDLFYLIP